MISVNLPIKTVAGLNAREHWRTRAKRVHAERATSYMTISLERDKPGLPVAVSLVRLSAGTLDDDNLQGAFKAIRDGVADAYGVPDNDPRIQWRYSQEKCGRGEFGVRIEVKAA